MSDQGGSSQGKGSQGEGSQVDPERKYGTIVDINHWKCIFCYKVVRRSIKHSKNVDYSKEKRSHHHRSRKHDKHILIHQMMTITTDPDSVYASTRTRQTMSMVIDTVLVNVQRKDEKTVENESVSKSDPEDSMQN
ncbi:unnamed protein product [Brassica oleracea]|uniref:BED-type domain-containing protein n=2 Tax=Brassica oleracea TaxID=3712 RepID=A0A0D3EB83_BRAOL|nr:unnamed protein product [Brassica oleracea]